MNHRRTNTQNPSGHGIELDGHNHHKCELHRVINLDILYRTTGKHI